MSNNGQVSIMYMLTTIAIAFILAAGVFLFSQVFRETLSETSATIGLDNVAQQIENALLELKQISDTTNASSANITIKIPTRIGDQKYSVTGFGSIGSGLELRSIGDPSIPKILPIKFWPILIRGSVDSGQGTLTFVLQNSTSVLLQ